MVANGECYRKNFQSCYDYFKIKEMIGVTVETAVFCCATNKMGCGTLLWMIVGKTARNKLNTSLQMVVLAFAVLLLKRL
ncbi:hypothetical protein BIY23_00980 [Wolbachia pipientis]|uniref:Uncharacterized protein n=1 Tax=Wolbachia pipientis TaxID=955 RepID=A0A1E7QKW2_WOLPI|nr:hypothetical protein BIY23_00980 [Wolbachia pipientis]